MTMESGALGRDQASAWPAHDMVVIAAMIEQLRDDRRLRARRQERECLQSPKRDGPGGAEPHRNTSVQAAIVDQMHGLQKRIDSVPQMQVEGHDEIR